MRPAILCPGLLLSIASFAQAPPNSGPPRFDAAVIHPSNPNESDAPSGCSTTPGFMRCSNVTLKRCITGAYGIGADRVLGGPDWINTDRFQITARSEQPLGDKGLMTMLQTLLADRFKLVLHRESRPGDAMSLEIGPKGPKLQQSSTAHRNGRTCTIASTPPASP